MAARRDDPKWARWGLLAATFYLGVCGIQRLRVLAATRAVAAERSDPVDRLDAFPMLPANLVWRTVYGSNGELVVDEARAAWYGPTRTRTGGRLPKLTAQQVPAVSADPGARRAFEVWTWFTNGWVARSPDDDTEIIDVRYGNGASSTRPMWGIRLHPGQSPPVERVDHARNMDVGAMWRNLWDERETK
jgi:inner membrane protein